MIDTEKYQPVRQNMNLVTRLLRSLATKLHIMAQQADIVDESKLLKYVNILRIRSYRKSVIH
jgi:hypothetical protein